VALFIVAASGVLAFQPYLQNNMLARVSGVQNCERPPGYVLLILDNNGLNDSVHRASPGIPAITLSFERGETINVLVCNVDTVQSHGFAVAHYFDRGVTLRPGDAYKVSFVAKDSGSFTIYCNVFCTVHPFMLGKLTVT
jgi:nitrous oxide reductase